ncbi:hypothetical protein QR685DRAFT_574852 [Neurospora intermedia]|uniref:Uncharacterized protein n=1 Tax=Neurospora intermedia TaxID=5142 RepID=A0ABR3D4J9_NEUIN
MEATTAWASKAGQSGNRICTIKGKDQCRYRLLVRSAGDIARNWRESSQNPDRGVNLRLPSGMEPGVESQAPETFFNSTAESRKRYCQSCNRPPAGPNPTKDLSRLVHRAPQIIKAKYRQGRHGQPSDINEVDDDDDDTLPHQSNDTAHLFPIPPPGVRAHRDMTA